MDVRNLVLEVGENESAESIQARLDKAAEDGFFLVNVVGCLAFLRTSISQKKPGQIAMTSATRPLANRDGKDETAKAIIQANPDRSIRELVGMLAEMGMKRGKTWIADARAGSK